MRFFGTVVMVLAAQLLVGCLALRSFGRAGGSRSLRHIAAWSLTALLGTVALELVFAPGFSACPLSGIWINPWVFLLLGALPGTGCCLALSAARTERHGRRDAARRKVRLGGGLLCLGNLALLVMAGADLILRPPFREALLDHSNASAMILTGGLVCLASSAWIAALAALSGKPNPSAPIAAIFYLCGLIGLIGAAHPVTLVC